MTHKPEKLDAKEAAKHMLKAKQILILSGADLSLESGIPSYDSDELWKRNGQKGPRPREYVTLKLLPNAGHEAITEFMEY
eukprot:CAMPEP_0176400662 /NCGR_PEP_ID=MMETSP0126-20121128/47789_1 /TAXON_ID=141414 ORGANISM="Strombidinopsis acuminatum, Strain SPMC142" /NCGR_SAMPLE_ID=MMETSP0126 /ASSEMBLY_ACC=CAM_ASM_000229 /LENGTH=79 /DNA_ID=CAMNT_0017777077 /DNA_START=233 /DNA_END=473 /DNA_ORIENTATION=+